MNFDHRQGFFTKEKPTELELRKRYTRDKVSEWVALPSKIAREVSRELGASWTSYFSLLLKWKKGGLPRKPTIPGYCKGNTRGVLPVAKDAIRASHAKRGNLSFAGLPRDAVVCPLPCGWERVKTARIVPRERVFDVLVVYDKKQPTAAPGNRTAGMDVGIDNLATVACDSPHVRPLIVDGKHLKSLNRHANKRSSQLQAEGKTRKAVWRVRNRQVKAELHWASKQIVDYLCDTGVGDLYIGWNTGWKSTPRSQSTMGKIGNQRFRSLPLRELVDMVAYKAALRGIRVIETEESYTSKTSLLDGELPSRREIYAGRRVHRGCFMSGRGQAINADVNAACQIARKCKPEAFSWAEGVVGEVGLLSPVRVSVGGGHPVTYHQVRHTMNMCANKATRS